MHDEKETLPFAEQMHILKRVLTYMKPFKKQLLQGFILIILVSITTLLSPYLLKMIMDKSFKETNVYLGAIVYYSILYAIVKIAYSIVRYIQLVKFSEIGFRIAQMVQVDAFTKVQYLGMRYFDQTPAGSIASRLTTDVNALQEMLNNVLSGILSGVFVIVGMFIAMFIMDTRLAVIMLFFLPCAMVLMYLYQKFSTKYYLIGRERLSRMNTQIAESIGGIHIIQIFLQEKRMAQKFSQTNQENYQAVVNNVRFDGLLLAPSIQLLTTIFLALMFMAAGIFSFENSITIGVIIAFEEYTYYLVNPILQVMDRLSFFQNAIVGAMRIFKIIDHQEVTPQQHKNASGTFEDAKIEFKNVSFSYDGKQEVLSNISFTVNPGETLAIVGHTGSGKSSIINVMMRFYEFSKGDVLIDGKSIKEYPMSEIRSKIGLVLQEPFLYYGTIEENIRLKNKYITSREIIEACKFVDIDSFIQNLSDGYEHQVNEQGASFSTGQKQLLAFARTIVTNPKILVLDEATANIDTETESVIQEGLEKIKKGRTSIAIAHRLSTIKDANQIIVLDKGHIIERGTHDELIEQKGTYYMMYQLQQTEAQLL